MAINRFSLYQMEQFKKERNRKLMESATKSVEECGFSSGEIKKMMKKKKNKKEDKEMEECGCGPMKKGKKLSKSEKAPGMRPEPKDKAVVHNMESDGNGLKATKVVISESKKSVSDIDKQMERIWKKVGGKKASTGMRELHQKANNAKAARGILGKVKSKKVGMPGVENQKNYRATKKTKESDTPVKATKVVISMHKMSESELEESKKSYNDIERQKGSLINRVAKKGYGRGEGNAKALKILRAAASAIKSRNFNDAVNGFPKDSATKKARAIKKGMPGVKGQKNYKAKK